MGVRKEIIVAIELGSSFIRGIAGYKENDGSWHVSVIEQEDSRSCIRKGVVYNVDKTVACLKTIIGKIENALDMRVAKVYVGVNGKSLKTERNVVTRFFDSKMVITPEHVQEMLEENSRKIYPNYEVLTVIPQEYRLELESAVEPIGVLSNQIGGAFLNVMVRKEVKEYIQTCLSMLNIEVAGYLVAPLLLSECALADTEKRMGCALVDFGASITTVVIYRKNILRYIGVVPLGADNITHDICSLAIEEAEAEDLKKKYCTALSEFDENAATKNLLLNASRSIDERELMEIVEAREWEILNNVSERIEQSGYNDLLPQGIVAAGGGAQMRAMDKAISECVKTGKVRILKQISVGVHSDSEAEVDFTHYTLLSLLNGGTENCVEEKEKVVIPSELQFQDYPDEEPQVEPIEEEDLETAESIEEEQIVADTPDEVDVEASSEEAGEIDEAEKDVREVNEEETQEKKPGVVSRFLDFLGKLVDE